MSPLHQQQFWTAYFASFAMWRVWRAYTSILQSHPIRTTTATASCITVAGDAIAQKIEASQEHCIASWDTARTAQMFAWGGVWMGAPQLAWFRWLHSLPFGLVPKLAIQLAVMPPATVTLFFGYTEAGKSIQGKAPWETWRSRYSLRMHKEAPTTVAYATMFWAPVQAFNFWRVPLQFRPLYLNCMMVVWTTYLSIVGFKRL